MKEIELRTVFNPVQPAVAPASRAAIYTESRPDPRLSKYIYCYWQLKSAEKFAAPFSYRVIPDGCIDIFFNMRDIGEPRIMGFSTRYTEFDLGGSFYYAGVRFLPGSFPLLFNVNAAELTDRDEHLSDVVPFLARDLVQHLESYSKFNSVNTILDNYFIKRIETIPLNPDKRIYNAINILLSSHGNINLKSDIDTGISPRQLRRLFEFYVGDTPKVFSKVVRFQYFFQLLFSEKDYAYNTLFHEAGYYDQPHFNKDFKIFFGLTPGEALRR